MYSYVVITWQCRASSEGSLETRTEVRNLGRSEGKAGEKSSSSSFNFLQFNGVSIFSFTFLVPWILSENPVPRKFKENSRSKPNNLEKFLD